MKTTRIIVSITLISLVGLLLGLVIEQVLSKDNTRNLEYEQYCDSIWDNDPEYYIDVLEETDEYQSYIEEHGKWWRSDN